MALMNKHQQTKPLQLDGKRVFMEVSFYGSLQSDMKRWTNLESLQKTGFAKELVADKCCGKKHITEIWNFEVNNIVQILK